MRRTKTGPQRRLRCASGGNKLSRYMCESWSSLKFASPDLNGQNSCSLVTRFGAAHCLPRRLLRRTVFPHRLGLGGVYSLRRARARGFRAQHVLQALPSASGKVSLYRLLPPRAHARAVPPSRATVASLVTSRSAIRASLPPCLSDSYSLGPSSGLRA